MNIAPVWKRATGAGGDGVSWADLLIREENHVYHAQAKQFLSSHRLSAFRECPLLYRKWQLGEIKDEDRPAYLVGRAAHALILEGREVYKSQYAVGGPINPRTGAPFGAGTKAFADWAEQLGKDVLSPDQASLVERMNDSVRSHPLASELLVNGIAEGVIRTVYGGLLLLRQSSALPAIIENGTFLRGLQELISSPMRPFRALFNNCFLDDGFGRLPINSRVSPLSQLDEDLGFPKPMLCAPRLVRFPWTWLLPGI